MKGGKEDYVSLHFAPVLTDSWCCGFQHTSEGVSESGSH